MTTIDATGVTTIDGRDVVHDGSFAPSQSQMTELRMLCARPLRASDKQAGDSCRWVEVLEPLHSSGAWVIFDRGRSPRIR